MGICNVHRNHSGHTNQEGKLSGNDSSFFPRVTKSGPSFRGISRPLQPSSRRFYLFYLIKTLLSWHSSHLAQILSNVTRELCEERERQSRHIQDDVPICSNSREKKRVVSLIISRNYCRLIISIGNRPHAVHISAPQDIVQPASRRTILRSRVKTPNTLELLSVG